MSSANLARPLTDPGNRAIAKDLAVALTAYFAGKPESFQGIPLDLADGTAFRLRVWEAARRIPWGQTSTYGALAAAVHCGSARAVGQALGANPVPLIIPCHRVLAANGGLGGFSCGLDWKRRLLGLERVSEQNSQP